MSLNGKLRMAQYGTRHGHAAGKLQAMQANARVEVAGVFEFERALAFVDIAAMETRPPARRFEVYGSQGSAINVEPFEPGVQIRLCLTEARDGYRQGEQFVKLDGESRQEPMNWNRMRSWRRSRASSHATDRCHMSWYRRPCCARPARFRTEPKVRSSRSRVHRTP